MFMKRKALALILILALSVSTVALQFVSLTSANFIGALILPNEPNTTPPTIVVHSPLQNETCNSMDLWLNFTVSKPKRFFGNVTSVWYTVDGGESQDIKFHDRFVNDTGSIFLPIKELDFSSKLKLTPGAHNIKVGLEAQSFYIDFVDRQGWIFPSVLVHAESEIVNFTQALVTEITSPENRTYDTGIIPLNFTVNAVVSQITYSLDGEENATIAGNTTLTGLANGDHNITVYATDEAGNTGVSETMYFSVDVPFPTTIVVTPLASVAFVGAGLLVYFKKRKR
jgi:hypothetical protein